MSVTSTEPIAKSAIGSLEDLILIRLLPPSKSPIAKKVLRTTLEKFAGEPLDDASFDLLTSEMAIRGLIEEKPYRLTDAGRVEALAFLGIDRLPARANWGTIQAKYLVPKVLGLKPTAETTVKVLKHKNNFAALLLKRKLELPVGTGPTLTNVLEAIVCQELGFPELTTIAALKEQVLSDKLDSTERLPKKRIESLAPRVLLGGTKSGMAGLRSSLFAGAFANSETRTRREPIAEPDPEPILVEPFDLAAFANTVKTAARECRTGRFGERKVFINHVWHSVKDESMFRDLDLARFKEKLIEANRHHLLELTRADMAAHLDQSDVLESETRYFNSEFHFIIDERDAQ